MIKEERRMKTCYSHFCKELTSSRFFAAVVLVMAFTFTNILLQPLMAQQWQMSKAPLVTPWAEDVEPKNVLPEYPRPQMAREHWKNLNGLWQFQEAKAGESLPAGRALKDHILVPFPWESALSGVRSFLNSRRAVLVPPYIPNGPT